MSKKPYVLCIMDGFGKNPSQHGNAIAMAKKPNLDKLMAECPYTYIGASGMDVGLPDGQMGNSEVGHTNMGAGRVVYQDLTRISKAFADGEAYKNAVLVGAMENAKDKALHLMGLVSPGPWRRNDPSQKRSYQRPVRSSWPGAVPNPPLQKRGAHHGRPEKRAHIPWKRPVPWPSPLCRYGVRRGRAGYGRGGGRACVL